MYHAIMFLLKKKGGLAFLNVSSEDVILVRIIPPDPALVPLVPVIPFSAAMSKTLSS